MTTFDIVDREHTPGQQGGTDYGSKPLVVLARSPVACLLWMPGGSYRSGLGMTSYASAYMRMVKGRSLSAWTRETKETFGHDQNQPAQRLTPALILERGARINEFFGAEIAEKLAESIKAKKTLLVDGGGDPFKKDATVERKKRQAAAEKIALASGVIRSIEPEVTCTCRQCGVKLRPALMQGYIEDGDDPVTSLEDLQRRHNAIQIISTEGHYSPTVENADQIGRYKYWDRTSYHNGPYFCHRDCAEAYAERAAEALPPLPIVPPPTEEELAEERRRDDFVLWGK